jgi:hypothetical protein
LGSLPSRQIQRNAKPIKSALPNAVGSSLALPDQSIDQYVRAEVRKRQLAPSDQLQLLRHVGAALLDRETDRTLLLMAIGLVPPGGILIVADTPLENSGYTVTACDNACPYHIPQVYYCPRYRFK